MRSLLPLASLTLVFAVGLSLGITSRSAEKTEPQLAHMVFFQLKDRSPESREKFLASGRKYLAGHEGVVYFSLGTIAEDVVEPGVSVRDFDVALHLVFKDKAAEAAYLKSPRHQQFVTENKELFAGVRVFDSYVKP